jgi:hypothetical protein
MFNLFGRKSTKTPRTKTTKTPRTKTSTTKSIHNPPDRLDLWKRAINGWDKKSPKSPKSPKKSKKSRKFNKKHNT